MSAKQKERVVAKCKVDGSGELQFRDRNAMALYLYRAIEGLRQEMVEVGKKDLDEVWTEEQKSRRIGGLAEEVAEARGLLQSIEEQEEQHRWTGYRAYGGKRMGPK